MEVEVIKSDKEDLEVKVDNLTVAEVLRVYLNEQGADFAAWKREHPTKPALLKVKASKGTAKKAVSEAIGQVKKDLAELEKSIKKV
tara:strand:+ start:6344 stop:6601 length:258 start_codon:yes stop_codon:yes gene_type:complete